MYVQCPGLKPWSTNTVYDFLLTSKNTLRITRLHLSPPEVWISVVWSVALGMSTWNMTGVEVYWILNFLNSCIRYMRLWCTINQERSESHRVPSAQWKWQVKGVELWGEKPLEKCARSQTCDRKVWTLTNLVKAWSWALWNIQLLRQRQEGLGFKAILNNIMGLRPASSTGDPITAEGDAVSVCGGGDEYEWEHSPT